MSRGLWAFSYAGGILLLLALLQNDVYSKSLFERGNWFVPISFSDATQDEEGVEMGNERDRRHSPCMYMTPRERGLAMTAVYQCTSTGLFSLEDECRIFLRCSRPGAIAKIDCCPTGFHFDKVWEVCVPISEAECTDLDSALIVADYMYEEPQDNGYYMDLNDNGMDYEDDEEINTNLDMKVAKAASLSKLTLPWEYYPAPYNLFSGAFWSRDPHNGHMSPALQGYAVPLSISYSTIPVAVVKKKSKPLPPPYPPRPGQIQIPNPVPAPPLAGQEGTKDPGSLATPTDSQTSRPSSPHNLVIPLVAPSKDSGASVSHADRDQDQQVTGNKPGGPLTEPAATGIMNGAGLKPVSQANEKPTTSEKPSVSKAPSQQHKEDPGFEHASKDSDEQATTGSKVPSPVSTEPSPQNEGFEHASKDSDEQPGVNVPSQPPGSATKPTSGGNDFENADKEQHGGSKLAASSVSSTNSNNGFEHTDKDSDEQASNTKPMVSLGVATNPSSNGFEHADKDSDEQAAETTPTKPTRVKGLRKRSKLESVAIINPKPINEADEGQKRKGSKVDISSGKKWFPRFNDDSEENEDPVQMGIIPLPEVGNTHGVLRKRAVNSMWNKKPKKRKTKRAHHRHSVKK